MVNLVISRDRTTPSARAATLAGMTFVAAAFPAAQRLAALAVATAREAGGHADAAHCDSATANEPADRTGPSRASRLASIALPLASRPDRVPWGQPSCRAASLWVFPPRSQRT